MKIKEKLADLKKHKFPLRFEDPEGKLIIEIQYLTEENVELNDGLQHFAVTTDGWDLLINTNLEPGLILQKEIDDIDSLGVTLADLLNAKKVSL